MTPLQREMSVGEFIAEMLESEADNLPPQEYSKALILRETARVYRQRQDRTMVQVFEREDLSEWAARLIRECKEESIVR